MDRLYVIPPLLVPGTFIACATLIDMEPEEYLVQLAKEAVARLTGEKDPVAQVQFLKSRGQK